MCELSTSRRALLGSAVAVGTGLAAPVIGAAPAQAAAHSGADGKGGTRLILLGTAGGPVPVAERFGMSSVLAVGDRNYLFDAGRGSVSQYVRAGLTLKSLRGIFVTHHHADHTADLFQYLLLGLISPDGDQLVPPVPVYGPGRAGELPPQWGKPRPAPLVNPANPTPGLKDLFADALNGWAYQFNELGREATMPEHPDRIMALHEIDVAPTGADPLRSRAPRMRPFTVFEDDRIRVSATLVPHGLVFPAFGYRVETPDGVIAFSGDTAYDDNVVELAHEADVLVHEAVSVDYYADRDPADGFIEHLKTAHTDVVNTGDVARRAGARKLVLSHLGPARPGMVPDRVWREGATRRYGGPVVVGNDLDVVRLEGRRG
ncbi:MBL fold metallo-hydrolase [Streptomyces sp. NPDC051684]|uniref:MBL fold metallo-hydrolase n=1 Tax=Streptomyces sp. NPDC051684 TaxID=3365670 RepID=UPI00378962E9